MTRTVDLYADDGGTGDPLPVVFLHSLAGNASRWSENPHPRRASPTLARLAH
jgi:hypothetical protein